MTTSALIVLSFGMPTPHSPGSTIDQTSGRPLRQERDAGVYLFTFFLALFVAAVFIIVYALSIN